MCRVIIDSDTAQGQKVQLDIVALAEECGYSQPEVFAIRLALEEALVNAIKHGNGSDPNKKVSIVYCVGPIELIITIKDEGQGFDPKTIPDPTQPENLERACGRGLMLMSHYMSQVSFSQQGNEVLMIKQRALVLAGE